MSSPELDVVREMMGGVDLSNATIAERRAFLASLTSPPETMPGTAVEPVDAGGIGAEWVAAEGCGERCVVYFHGGAYHMGAPGSIRHLAAALSAACAARFLSVDYRLAPEHPFPAAVDDAVTAYRWLVASGVDPSHVALAGDSAGGGLALAALLALRDAGDPLPAAVFALSPWLDLAITGESVISRAAVDVMVRPEGIVEAADLYLRGQDPRHPYASPLYGDLRGLPPILVHVGDAEVLLDDSTRFAARARAAGVDVTLEVADEMPHVWHSFVGLLPEATTAIERVGAWLQARVAALTK